MSAQNFNFAPNFPQNGAFPPTNFVSLEEHFPTTTRNTFQRECSDMLKLRGRNCPPATTLVDGVLFNGLRLKLLETV